MNPLISNVTNRQKKTAVSAASSQQRSPITLDSTGYNDLLDEIKSYMRGLLDSQTESIRQGIAEIKNAIESQNQRLNQLEARISLLETKADKIQPLSTIASNIESTIAQLEAKIADRDQALLSNDVEVAGCSEEVDENCTRLVVALSKRLGVDLDEKDIVFAGRVGPMRKADTDGAPGLPRPLVVRLARRAPRDALLQAARKRGVNTDDLKLPGPTRPLYINERLTRHNRLLFLKVKALARDAKLKYVWIRDARIFVRQEQGKPRYRIRTESDFSNFFGNSHI